MSDFTFIAHPFWYLILLGVWIYCLVDALRFHRSWFWVLFVLCLGPLAAIVYLPNFKLSRHRSSGLLDDFMADILRLKALQEQARESSIPSIHLQIAEIHVRRQRWQEALDELGKALDQDDENTRGHFLAGTCFRALGQPEAALAHLEFVLEQDPRASQGRARLTFANALLDLQRKDEAAAEFDRVLAAFCLPEAALKRARLFVEAGQRSAARQVLAEALDRASEFPADRKAEERCWIQAARQFLNDLQKEPDE